jgi:hypothetical protein
MEYPEFISFETDSTRLPALDPYPIAEFNRRKARFSSFMSIFGGKAMTPIRFTKHRENDFESNVRHLRRQ